MHLVGYYRFLTVVSLNTHLLFPGIMLSCLFMLSMIHLLCLHVVELILGCEINTGTTGEYGKGILNWEGQDLYHCFYVISDMFCCL